MNAKEFFGKFTSGYLLGHLIAMAVVVMLLCAGVWYGLRWYTHHGQGIKIPNVVGMDYDKAFALLVEDGLQVVVTDSGYNKRMPANTVLGQLPAGGMMVKEGRTVSLTINSLQSPRVSLPDLIDNSSYREAQARLQAMGFRMLEPKLIEGEKDWVYGIQTGGHNLQTGDMVSTESPLTLVIGRGGFGDEEDEMMEEEMPADGEDDVDTFLEVPDGSEDE